MLCVGSLSEATLSRRRFSVPSEPGISGAGRPGSSDKTNRPTLLSLLLCYDFMSVERSSKPNSPRTVKTQRLYSIYFHSAADRDRSENSSDVIRHSRLYLFGNKTPRSALGVGSSATGRLILSQSLERTVGSSSTFARVHSTQLRYG